MILLPGRGTGIVGIDGYERYRGIPGIPVY